jgi:hypothetical protein
MVARGASLVAVGLICAAPPARAEDLWLSADVGRLSVNSDVSTLTCERDQCSVWEITHYADPQPDGALSLRDLVYYDCIGLRTRTQTEIKLGADGKVLTTVKATEDSWFSVQPDTVGGDTLAFACHYKSADATELQSGAFDFAGRHFLRLTKIASAGEPPPSAPPIASAPTQAARMAVQIGASPTAVGAHRAVAAFETKHRDELTGLRFQIEPARLNDRQVYRALIEGFAADHDAQAFCAKLKQNGADCFTRSAANGEPHPAGGD